MPRTKIFFYKDKDGIEPCKDWLSSLSKKTRAKGYERIRLWAEMGNELRRPYVDYLADGIYELRWRIGNINYRILYYFRGEDIVILSHGFTKEKKVPKKEIALALDRKKKG
ncbi:MAG: type II toxin-antitoxin system RelE/ParE family toxin [Candidatus Electryonea clarkiae]|nr:type II toxin-antitoxin system RelE/ParE family toxin [Candidatus Electryonea clarkiae]MDP8287156.1 type II toxin-antitoxin system RelE/ParE family toxin [Candidatus Electryonea clarkiae]